MTTQTSELIAAPYRIEPDTAETTTARLRAIERVHAIIDTLPDEVRNSSPWIPHQIDLSIPRDLAQTIAATADGQMRDLEEWVLTDEPVEKDMLARRFLQKTVHPFIRGIATIIFRPEQLVFFRSDVNTMSSGCTLSAISRGQLIEQRSFNLDRQNPLEDNLFDDGTDGLGAGQLLIAVADIGSHRTLRLRLRNTTYFFETHSPQGERVIIAYTVDIWGNESLQMFEPVLDFPIDPVRRERMSRVTYRHFEPNDYRPEVNDSWQVERYSLHDGLRVSDVQEFTRQRCEGLFMAGDRYIEAQTAYIDDRVMTHEEIRAELESPKETVFILISGGEIRYCYTWGIYGKEGQKKEESLLIRAPVEPIGSEALLALRTRLEEIGTGKDQLDVIAFISFPPGINHRIANVALGTDVVLPSTLDNEEEHTGDIYAGIDLAGNKVRVFTTGRRGPNGIWGHHVIEYTKVTSG